MFNYIRIRLLQPTTWLGVASIVCSMFTGGFDPQMVADIAVAVGLIHIDEGRVIVGQTEES